MGVDSVLEQIEISNSQFLKPLQNQQKSVLEQIEISNSQFLKPLRNQQKSVLEQIEISNSQFPKPLQNQQKSVLEQIELLELDKSGIHVAEYLTVLPRKELLQAKLQEAITINCQLFL